MYKKTLSSFLMIAIMVITSGGVGLLSPKVANAASLTAFSDTVSDLTANATASHVIKFTTPTGIVAGSTVVLTFDNSTSTSGVLFSDVAVLDDATPITVNAGAPTTTNWGFVNASPVITFTTGTGTVTAGSIMTITFNGTNKITNGSAGTTTLKINGTFGDTGILGMAIIADGVVVVTAEVLGSITFTVDENTIDFGTLTASNSRYANTSGGSDTLVTALNLTAGTNGSTGYTLSVQGDTLTSGANTITALSSPLASIPGTEQFGIHLVESGTGTGVVEADYATNYAYQATGATADTIATAVAATDISSYAVSYLANISALTEAGSYTTAHTYVATGNF